MTEKESLNKSLYLSTVTKDGPLKTLFKAFKAGTDSYGFDKTFITGVTPVVMSDITSGYNIADNIYNDKQFNGLCGFYADDVRSVLEQVYRLCNITDDSLDNMMLLIEKYFDGHKFSPYAEENVYNPTLVLYFLKKLLFSCEPPRDMLDDNMAVDYQKIEYISNLSNGKEIVFDLSENGFKTELSRIQQRFGIKNLLSDDSKDKQFILSYLYYVGSLTVFGETDSGFISLQIPNLVMKNLYMDRIKFMLFPEPQNRDIGIDAAKILHTQGDIAPLCEFVENNALKVFSNRDYAWANELTIKTMFLALTYNDILYIMDSEKEIRRSYMDLTMIIRPDKRHFKIFDILFEFKYVSLKTAKLTGNKAKSLSKKQLRDLPCIKEAMKEAKKQARAYSKKLNAKYRNLKLKTFAIVCLGFDRIYWKEVL
ncbi:MAG: AAA family ATPase [Candidatus Magnetomorum sp.]|nr:AAA family ATPase [Candidatus Magnetomorum sp.]